MLDLPPSPALSIVQNGPKGFKGRKLGVLVSDGTDAALLGALESATESAGGLIELVAPQVNGFRTSDGSLRPAKQKINGGPSVLYDAVAILVSAGGAALLGSEATARDFVADAFAHATFIGFVNAAKSLLDKAGIAPDGGCLALAAPVDAQRLVTMCGDVRFWQREKSVHAV